MGYKIFFLAMTPYIEKAFNDKIFFAIEDAIAYKKHLSSINLGMYRNVNIYEAIVDNIHSVIL